MHIADTTAEAVRGAGLSTVGLLATAYTMEQDFYVGRLRERHGLDVLIPDAGDRRLVHDVIYERAVRRRGERRARATSTGGSCATSPSAARRAILLGCTEIDLLVGPQDSPVPSSTRRGCTPRARSSWRSPAPRRGIFSIRAPSGWMTPPWARANYGL